MFNKAYKAPLITGVFLSLLSTNLFAADIASDINVSRQYDTFKLTLGGSMGGAHFSSAGESATSTSVFGELGLLRGFGLHVAYMDLGEVGSGPGTAKTKVTFIGGRGFKRLSLQFGLYGKLGLGLWDYSTKSYGSDNGANPMWGYGVEWRLTPGMKLSMGMDVINFNPKPQPSYQVGEHVNRFNVGLAYTFY